MKCSFRFFKITEEKGANRNSPIIYLGKLGEHKYSCKMIVFHSVVIALKRRRLRVEWGQKSSGLGVKVVSKAVITT